MKKVTILLVLVAMLASVFGTGAASANKLIRLDIYNVSGDTVYMKLEATVGDAYYYLTIPDDETMNYTIETDLYKRTTWACGNKTTGRLAATSNLRLKFIECDRLPLRTVWWLDVDGDGLVDGWEVLGHHYVAGATLVKVFNYGEPTMEKVQYFKWVMGGQVYGSCAGWTFEFTFRSPAKGLCAFRYRY